MHRLSRIIAALTVTVMLASCASFMNGGRQPLTLRSSPNRALYTIFDLSTGKRIERGYTPMKVYLRRGHGYMKGNRYRIVFEFPDLPPKWVDVEPRVNGYYLVGNVLLGGVIGWVVVDPLTGGMWTLSPDKVTVDLNDTKQSSMAPYDGFQVVKLSDLPPEIRTHLVPFEEAR